MKKIFSLILLLIFLFNVVGYFIAFKAEQFQIKSEIQSEIRSGIISEELSIITINKKDPPTIQWTEEGKEMRYKDEFYDVVKYTETETTISYYCINDSKEDSLFANLNAHIDLHVAAKSSPKSSKKLNDHVIKVYFSNKPQFIIMASISGLFTNRLTDNLIYTSSFIQNTTPPPEFI